MSKVKYVCACCGNDDITRDATARWDIDKQDWDLSSYEDATWCGECGDECDIRKEIVE
jgi:predicted RNA-binding Zn-ribbon protein involved in translation (DUF1610 family)